MTRASAGKGIIVCVCVCVCVCITQAISHGITKAGVGVNTLNLELASLEEVAAAVKQSDGFILGKCAHAHTHAHTHTCRHCSFPRNQAHACC